MVALLNFPEDRPAMFEDRMIECCDCGQEFLHSAQDQERYAERGFEHDPKRCRDCREKKKASSGGGGGGGGSRGHRHGGGGGGGGHRSHGGGGGGGGYGDRPQREFHEAVCSECGQTTTVPFKPKPGRPVFCRDCYRSQAR